MRLIIDVMSGDAEPLEAVKGAFRALDELSCDITLVGDEESIKSAIKEISRQENEVKIVHAETVVTMEDDYLVVIKSKKNSSMSIGLTLLRDGEGDAFISTGNTGALVAGATLILRKIKGVKAACIGAVLPLDNPVLLVDSGANVEPDAKSMHQFASMGEIYARNMLGLENPRVGLINNGAEHTKGNTLARETYAILSEDKSTNFVGNIEGRDIVDRVCDVLVADGYTGNIILKLVEGFGRYMSKTLKGLFFKNLKTKIGALFLAGEAKAIKKKMDYTEYGGAPLLGVAKPVIKAHGNSNAKALFSACRQAIAVVETGVVEEISEKAEQWRAVRKEAEHE